MALEHRAHLFAADRLDDFEYVLRVDAVPCDGITINPYAHGGQADDLLRFDIRSTGNTFDEPDHFIGFLFHPFKIIAVDLDPDVASHARHQLGDAQFDRLRVAEDGSGHFFLQRFVDGLDERFLGLIAPRILVFKYQIGVADLDAHRVGGDFGPARARDDGFDLGEPFLEYAFNMRTDFVGFLKRNAGKAPDLHRDCPLVEARNELGTEKRGKAEAGEKHHDCCGEHAPRFTDDSLEHGVVNALGESEQKRLLFTDLLEEQRCQYRHEG